MQGVEISPSGTSPYTVLCNPGVRKLPPCAGTMPLTAMAPGGGGVHVALSSARVRSSSHGATALAGRNSALRKFTLPRGSCVAVRAAVDMKTELQEFAAAEKRWQKQVRDGKVKSLTPREAGYACQLAEDSCVLLDVRPPSEREKSWVKGSVWVPAFEPDKSLSPGTLLDKLSTYLFGGWWSGNVVTKRNERFMADVVAKVPKGANVIVACQRGLRSLAACEHLYKAGYRNISWINGGFDAAEEEDFKREGPQPLKFAGLGGFSEFIGMTEPQRKKAQEEGLGYRAIFFARGIAVLLAFDAAFLALQQLSAFIRGAAE